MGEVINLDERVEFGDADANDCRDLWRRVLHRAVVDVTRYNPKTATDDQFGAHRDALNWFAGDGADFREVCCMAGFDPDVVRRRILDDFQTKET